MFAAPDAAQPGVAHDPDAETRLRQQVRRCHADLERAAAAWLNTTRPSVVWSPPVRLYVHALCVEDITIQSILREVAPLFTWLWQDLGSPPDAAALRRYTRAVYASTDVYFVNLASGGLNKVVDLNRLGLGRPTVAWVFEEFIVAELARTSSAIAGMAPTATSHQAAHDAGHRAAPRATARRGRPPRA